MKRLAWPMVVVLVMAAVGCVSEPTYTRRSYYAPGVPYQVNSATGNAVTSDRPIVIKSPVFDQPAGKKKAGFWQRLFGGRKEKADSQPLEQAPWATQEFEPIDK